MVWHGCNKVWGSVKRSSFVFSLWQRQKMACLMSSLSSLSGRRDDLQELFRWPILNRPEGPKSFHRLAGDGLPATAGSRGRVRAWASSFCCWGGGGVGADLRNKDPTERRQILSRWSSPLQRSKQPPGMGRSGRAAAGGAAEGPKC